PWSLPPLRRSDLAEGDLRFLHACRGIVAIGCDRVRAFAKHHGIGALRVIRAEILAAKPAAEVEGHPSHALSDALGHQRFHLRFGAVLRSGYPYPGAVLDAAFGRVGRVDLDEHVLLQLGEPAVRP